LRLRLAEYKTHIVNTVDLSRDTPKRSAARCLTAPRKKLLAALAGLDPFELIDPTTVCQGMAVSFVRPDEVRFGALTTTQSLGTCLPAFSTATALQQRRTPNYRCCLIDHSVSRTLPARLWQGCYGEPLVQQHSPKISNLGRKPRRSFSELQLRSYPRGIKVGWLRGINAQCSVPSGVDRQVIVCRGIAAKIEDSVTIGVRLSKRAIHIEGLRCNETVSVVNGD